MKKYASKIVLSFIIYLYWLTPKSVAVFLQENYYNSLKNSESVESEFSNFDIVGGNFTGSGANLANATLTVNATRGLELITNTPILFEGVRVFNRYLPYNISWQVDVKMHISNFKSSLPNPYYFSGVHIAKANIDPIVAFGNRLNLNFRRSREDVGLPLVNTIDSGIYTNHNGDTQTVADAPIEDVALRLRFDSKTKKIISFYSEDYWNFEQVAVFDLADKWGLIATDEMILSVTALNKPFSSESEYLQYQGADYAIREGWISIKDLKVELEDSDMVYVGGGSLPESSDLAGMEVNSFYISQYETTWEMWKTVREWSLQNGYSDLWIGDGSRDDHPVRNVSWIDAVKWCNARSEMVGLQPVYKTVGNVLRNGTTFPTIDSSANGYRLPTEAEWEWAAQGGQFSGNFTYAGSNTLDEVAWNMSNSQNAIVDLVGNNTTLGTWPIAQKLPNELGIFDMSGNVMEWCWDQHDEYRRKVRGGGFWIHGYQGVRERYFDGFDDRNVNIGFRVVKNATAPLVPTLSWDNPSPITYGIAISNIQLNAVSNIDGTFSYNPAAGEILPVGNQTLRVVFSPSDTGNYTTASANVTLKINDLPVPSPSPSPSPGFTGSNDDANRGFGGGGGGAPSGGGGGGEPEKSKKGKKGQDKNDGGGKKSSAKKSDKKDNDQKDSKRKDSDKKDSDKKSPGKKTSGGKKKSKK